MSLRLTLQFIRLHAANCVDWWSVIKTLTLAAIIMQANYPVVMLSVALCFTYVHVCEHTQTLSAGIN